MKNKEKARCSRTKERGAWRAKKPDDYWLTSVIALQPVTNLLWKVIKEDDNITCVKKRLINDYRN